VKITRKPSKNAFFPAKQEKTLVNAHRTQENDFLKSALMRFHTTHHIYKFVVRKKVFENIFFFEKSPVQPLSKVLVVAGGCCNAFSCQIWSRLTEGT